MKLRDNKGSITIFVLVGLLFMSSFLLLSYGSNVNKSKTAKEMFNMVSSTYSYNDGDENAYMRAYTALRKQNAQEITSSNEGKEDTSTLELTKTFYGPINNYTIYGNSVQDTETYGTPSPTNPVEIQSVGDLVTDTTDENYGKYKIEVKVTGMGNNLLDLTQLQGITSNGGNATSTQMVVNTNRKGIIMQCEPNTKYVLQLSNSTSIFRLFFYETKPILGETISIGGGYWDAGAHTGSTVAKFTTPSNAKWIGIALGTNEEMENTKAWLTKGTEEVEYEPYQGQTFNIYLDEPLRKVGDYKDIIDFKTGTITRAVGVYKFNPETLYFTNNGAVNNNLYNSYISFKGSTIPAFIGGTRVSGFSNVLPSNLQSWKNWTQEQVHFGQVNAVFYLITQNQYTNLDDLYNYLSNNGTTDAYFVYALKETAVTEIDLQNFVSYEDYTKIEVLTEIAPSKIEVTYDGYTFEK